MAWKLSGNFKILLLEILYLRKAVGIGTPFTHSQKSHYCPIHSVHFYDQTDLVIITVPVSQVQVGQRLLNPNLYPYPYAPVAFTHMGLQTCDIP